LLLLFFFPAAKEIKTIIFIIEFSTFAMIENRYDAKVNVVLKDNHSYRYCRSKQVFLLWCA